MRRSSPGVVATSLLVVCGCAPRDGAPAARSGPTIESMRTSLAAGACREQPDPGDPNDTPHLVCPGVLGYALIVRRVDAGRESIDVVDSARRVFPLAYDEFVTRHMASVSDTAEWRIETRDGTRRPIALIVRVQAHEDDANPEVVTHAYFAVAKVTPDTACVTRRILERAPSGGEVRGAADSAQSSPCAPPQPPMTSHGAVIR